MEEIYQLIGRDSDSIEWWQMSIRAVIVFLLTSSMVRFGPVRAFGKNTAFDIVISIVLGSILSRAITANSPFFSTIITAIVLVLLHYLLASLALKSRRIGWFIKGKEQCLVKDGIIQTVSMNRNIITLNDLDESLRKKGVSDIKAVKYAYLERSGDISIILKDEYR